MHLGDRDREARRLSVLAVAAGVAVLGGKLYAAHLTGSVGVFADALESGVNVLAALMLLLTVRFAARPADPEHPYGHHKAEYLASFTEGLLIGVAGVLIVQGSVQRLLDPQPLPENFAGLLIVAAVSGLNLALGLHLRRRGAALHSPALRADGDHLLSDVYTSVAVIAGVLLAMLTGWPVVDPLIGLLMAGVLLWLGYRVVTRSLSGLLDEARPDDARRIARVLAGFADEFIEYHDLRTRRAGPQVFADFHLILPASLPLGEVHGLSDRIEAALAREFPGINATIHAEPEQFARGGR